MKAFTLLYEYWLFTCGAMEAEKGANCYSYRRLVADWVADLSMLWILSADATVPALVGFLGSME